MGRRSAQRRFRGQYIGEWSAWHGDAGVELAIVHDRERPVGSSRQYDGDNSTGWICERESSSEPGATPAGSFYTAVYYLSDGTTSTSTGWFRWGRR